MIDTRSSRLDASSPSPLAPCPPAPPQIGGKWTITQADVGQSNGVVHVVDTVLMPK
ncbi:fasciclin domain-containing protein [Brevundimonas sp.]|uniref:fasciclin domain-containing protein n=1 Tax=Brevundimonas sp. TaxID=1871086 RepID=UPI002897A1AA|nr:fasciclin domain-containing protein [Brevundimonas sp.]